VGICHERRERIRIAAKNLAPPDPPHVCFDKRSLAEKPNWCEIPPSPDTHCGGGFMPDPGSDPYRHPIGTLAIVGIYGLLFLAGWLAVYFYVYLSRGAVTP
jgi:hypothetical protein